jgi:hypothetical protein
VGPLEPAAGDGDGLQLPAPESFSKRQQCLLKLAARVAEPAMLTSLAQVRRSPPSRAGTTSPPQRKTPSRPLKFAPPAAEGGGAARARAAGAAAGADVARAGGGRTPPPLRRAPLASAARATRRRRRRRRRRAAPVARHTGGGGALHRPRARRTPRPPEGATAPLSE